MYELKVTAGADGVAWTPVDEGAAPMRDAVEVSLNAVIHMDALRIPARLTSLTRRGCELEAPSLLMTRDEVRMRVYRPDGTRFDVDGFLAHDNREVLGLVPAVFELSAPNDHWDAMIGLPA
ncbi:MAG: hypothetical protein AAFQ82_16245 [Myxococcota bacterium]